MMKYNCCKTKNSFLVSKSSICELNVSQLQFSLFVNTNNSDNNNNTNNNNNNKIYAQKR